MPLNPQTGEFYEGSDPLRGVYPATGKSVVGHYQPLGILSNLERRTIRTPDFTTLRMHPEILLFVYGHEQTAGKANEFLKGARFLGFAHTFADNFVMQEVISGGEHFPVVFNVRKDSKRRNRIRGEAYAVQVDNIHLLDLFNTNGVCYARKKRRIRFEDGPPHTGHVKMWKGFAYDDAWMYLGKTEFWADRKAKTKNSVSFSAKPHFKDIPFYQHTNLPQAVDTSFDEWGYGPAYGGYSHDPHIG